MTSIPTVETLLAASWLRGVLRESLVALQTVIRSGLPATTGTPFEFLDAAGDAFDQERSGHA